MMETKLTRISQLSKQDPNMVFTSVWHLINEEILMECHREIDGDKAVGTDVVTKEMYSSNLEANVKVLVGRLKQRLYNLRSARRVEIPKDNGKTRPLTIHCYEDTLVQEVLKRIPEAVFEPYFYEEIMGFRPDRGCHQALRMLNGMIMLNIGDRYSKWRMKRIKKKSKYDKFSIKGNSRNIRCLVCEMDAKEE